MKHFLDYCNEWEELEGWMFDAFDRSPSRILCLIGPSPSGKTTLARELMTEFENNGRQTMLRPLLSESDLRVVLPSTDLLVMDNVARDDSLPVRLLLQALAHGSLVSRSLYSENVQELPIKSAIVITGRELPTALNHPDITRRLLILNLPAIKSIEASA